MNAVHRGHLRAVEFAQLVQRLISGDAFGAQPIEQGFECLFAPVPLITDSFRRTIALNHEGASCSGSPTSEQLKNLRFDREYSGTFVGLE
jgi:hypothetical protein